MTIPFLRHLRRVTALSSTSTVGSLVLGPGLIWGLILGLGACGASAGGGSDDGQGRTDAGDETCVEGATTCNGNTFMTCNAGEFTVTSQCVAAVCDNNLGCVDCRPDQNFCDGNTVVSCDAGGNVGGVVEECSGGNQCSNGVCKDLCEEAVTARSYIGCEYYAVDLDNAVQVDSVANSIFGCALAATPGVVRIDDMRVCMNGSQLADECDGDGSCPAGFSCETADVCALSADASPFAIVVSNPHGFAVEVTLDNGSGHSQTTSVPAHQVASIYPGKMGFADQSVAASSITNKAYRVKSTAPVVAYQFNPLDNEGVFSNDGSLLIPQHAFDKSYYSMTWGSLARRPGGRDFNGYITAVAWKDNTKITVTPTANVRAGMTMGAIPKGQSRTFTLNAFEVLNLEAVANGDLTGSRIEGNETIGVFSGHEAVSILSPGAQCCADHIEEMMLPTSTWGTEYAIARSQKRVDETDILRIMAQNPSTEVTVSSGQTCPTLAPGEFCEIEIGQDVEIVSTEPVLIGHYLESVIIPDPFFPADSVGNGDPSLAIAVPTEQFRKSYDFLVPAEYETQYISVVTDIGGELLLDGVDISGSLQPIASGTRVAGRIEVTPGQHDLSCAAGCGLEVYGYSDAVSYLFAGGLDLEQIVID